MQLEVVWSVVGTTYIDLEEWELRAAVKDHVGLDDGPELLRRYLARDGVNINYELVDKADSTERPQVEDVIPWDQPDWWFEGEYE